MAEMQLARLAVHARTREPLAILVELAEGGDSPTDRCVVVAMRPPQAEVVSVGRQPRRGDDERLTQDLLADLATAVGRRLRHAAIVDLVDHRFRAELVLDDGTAIPARPSDALAVGVRDGLPILVADHVLEQAGQSFSALGGDAATEHEQVHELRRLLDSSTAEDFRPGPEAGPAR